MKPWCCELCNIPLFLYPEGDGYVCGECLTKVLERDRGALLNGKPCPECGRIWTWKTTCNWCFSIVCDGCIHMEHNDNADCVCLDEE